MSALFQAGLIAGMLQGICDGDITFKTLAQHGDMGLGTINGVDGEMIAVDGKFYRIDVDGVAHIIQPNTCTPFSIVTQFKPTAFFTLENITSLAVLNKALDAQLVSKNIFYMLRIEGEFERLQVRSEACQPRPYKPLAETLPKLQKIFELTDMQGTIVTSYCPMYSAGITVPLYHHHFIDDAKTTGGHVFDVALKKASVSIMPIRDFNLVLFNTPDFDQMNLTIDLTTALKQVEGSPHE